MNFLKFSFHKNTSPPDRFRWRSPLGVTIIEDERERWFSQIRKHCIDNGIPLADDWREQAEHQLCLILPPGYCKYSNGEMPASYVETRMTLDDWQRGMAVLSEVVTGDNPLVEQDAAEQRARTCAACPANITIRGCGPCIAMADFILKIKGRAKTQSDSKLAQCAVCHCSNKAQVWVRIELLAKGVDGAMMEKFSQFEHCWKARELIALQNNNNPP